MTRLSPDSKRVIVKRTLYDNGKAPPMIIYASIDSKDAIPQEPVYRGKFISYGRRAGNIHGTLIELWQKIYIGDGEPDYDLHKPCSQSYGD